MLWPRITVLAIVLRINTPKARHEVAASLSTIIHLRRAGLSHLFGAARTAFSSARQTGLNFLQGAKLDAHIKTSLLLVVWTVGFANHVRLP
jgi:hypothetical protein